MKITVTLEKDDIRNALFDYILKNDVIAPADEIGEITAVLDSEDVIDIFEVIKEVRVTV